MNASLATMKPPLGYGPSSAGVSWSCPSTDHHRPGTDCKYSGYHPASHTCKSKSQYEEVSSTAFKRDSEILKIPTGQQSARRRGGGRSSVGGPMIGHSYTRPRHHRVTDSNYAGISI